ncbi:Metallo-dependent phosphatase-like protein [Thamnocephalis sphaerospora]|uniref:Metallo-dependent phosphatase-like protein n=1 Tax=Thamnocephalis sphaerospora TaxID=78915 RepID=A0A4P9XIE5_9FUNG|nr:Metallo-dependent phosphatase-like protein [Thamnocephalis sphaerospora]|eukprot:RKP05463.1 Metallo-dependent phosphatase-like protein [Thamnocephalis sphaerospora]
MLIGDDGGARPLNGHLFRARCWDANRVNYYVNYAPKHEDPNSQTFRKTSELAKRRIVAVGDLHGDMDSALSVLRMARVIDNSGRWSGGSNTVLVQTGNIIDYGPDTKDLLTFFAQLVQEANRAGGRVIQLLGNHEIMNMAHDLRFVRERSDEFLSPESRATTFSSTGYLGFRLSNLPVVRQINDTVFVHGGITLRWADNDIQVINQYAKAQLDSYIKRKDTGTAARYPFVLDESSPIHYDGYLEDPERVACEALQRVLLAMGVKRMVVGHTLQESGKIYSRCNGRLLAINTGISRAIQGKHSALEILPGNSINAIYPSGLDNLANL